MSGIFRDLVSGFNSPATLINPRIRDETAWHYWPRKGKAYQCLARKAAGFCLLLSFGISLETIHLNLSSILYTTSLIPIQMRSEP
jgi:hypothetical protein